MDAQKKGEITKRGIAFTEKSKFCNERSFHRKPFCFSTIIQRFELRMYFDGIVGQIFK